ncbi:MAG: hypothetical protein ACK4TR_08795 [Phenylobacterium sp.]|uniref:hypothetical protein n=1 Tax=Phenylobacterium sp. TaxID=1871053 RepID=UPI00391A5506
MTDRPIIQREGLTLVHKATGEPCREGDSVTSFRGEPATVTGGTAPRHPGSTGRVLVRDAISRGQSVEFYPSVFGLAWVAR